MHVVFVVDTSASMAAPTADGISHLDATRIALQSALNRHKHAQLTYSILTYQPGLKAVQQWQQRPSGHDLKLGIENTDLTLTNEALSTAFRLLNLDRISQKSSLFGQGRYIYEADPAIVVHIGDNGRIVDTTGTPEDPTLHADTEAPGHELYRHCYRWDQKLFSITLDLTGIAPTTTTTTTTSPPPAAAAGTTGSPVLGTASPTATPATDATASNDSTDQLAPLCEATGGACAHVKTRQMLEAHVDALVKQAAKFVVIRFSPLTSEREQTDPSQVPPHTVQTVQIPQQRAQTWPIPEPYWLPSVQAIPKQDAQPLVHVSPTPRKPLVVAEFPFDKYPLSPSPLTRWVLSHRRPGLCFYCFVRESHAQPGPGRPFGYLKPSSDLQGVNLVVLPYDFESLNKLTHAFFKVHGKQAPPQWRRDFSMYLESIPSYYYGPLKAVATTRLGRSVAHDIPPEQHPSSFSILRTLRAQARAYQEEVLGGLRSGAVHTETSSSSGARSSTDSSARTTATQPATGRRRRQPSEAVQMRQILHEGMMAAENGDPAFTGANALASVTGGVSSDAQRQQQQEEEGVVPKSNLISRVRQLQTQLRLAAAGVVSVTALDDQRFDQTEEALNMERIHVTLKLQEEASDVPLFGNPYRLVRGKVDEADDLSLDRRRPSNANNGERTRGRKSGSRRTLERASSPIAFSAPDSPAQPERGVVAFTSTTAAVDSTSSTAPNTGDGGGGDTSGSSNKNSSSSSSSALTRPRPVHRHQREQTQAQGQGGMQPQQQPPRKRAKTQQPAPQTIEEIRTQVFAALDAKKSASEVLPLLSAVQYLDCPRKQRLTLALDISNEAHARGQTEIANAVEQMVQDEVL